MLCALRGHQAVVFLLEIEDDILNAFRDLVPVFQRLYVDRANDMNSASQEIFHEVASNEAPRSANDRSCSKRIHHLFRSSCCHHDFLERLMAALSMKGQRDLMAIYYREHAKLSEFCNRIVTRCTGVPAPFNRIRTFASSNLHPNSRQPGDDLMTNP
jgi:hypothetical protein